MNLRHNVDDSQLTEQELIVNMMRNISVAPSQRRYSVKMMRVAMLLACISLACYIMMRKFLILSHYSALFCNFHARYKREFRGYNKHYKFEDVDAADSERGQGTW